MTTTTTNPCEQVLTIQEAAALVDRTESTIRAHLRAGVLAGRRLGGELRGVWIIDRAKLEAYYQTRQKDHSVLATGA